MKQPYADDAGTLRSQRRAALGFLACSVVLTFALASCRSAPPPRAAPPKPVYTPEESALFNDLFRPELFGNPGFSTPEGDGLLPERVRSADSVFAGRVVTITRDQGRDERGFSIVVVPAEPSAIAGRTLTESVSLTVPDSSPTFAALDAALRSWVGTRLLLFVRFYEDGAHFHGVPDTPDVRAAIVRAKLPMQPQR